MNEVSWWGQIISTLCGFCIFIASALIVFKKRLRPKIKVRANCWFCNQDSYIQFVDLNSWTCKSCDQYNGFKEDGDYNKPLPSQFCAEFNRFSRAEPPKDEPPRFAENGFCEKCNLNQTLKVKFLAEFVPSCMEYFDDEINSYKKQLEKNYPLCRTCEANLHLTLGKQDSWLRKNVIKWFSSPKKKSSILSDSTGSECSYWVKVEVRPGVSVCILRHMVVLLSLVLLVCNYYQLQEHYQYPSNLFLNNIPVVIYESVQLVAPFTFSITVLTIVMELLAIIISGRESVMLADFLSALFWSLLFIIQLFPSLFLFLDHLIWKAVLSTFCIAISLWSVTFKPSFVMRKHELSNSCSESCSNASREIRDLCEDWSSSRSTLTPSRSSCNRGLYISTRSAFSPPAPKSHLETIDSTLENLKISDELHSYEGLKTPFRTKTYKSPKLDTWDSCLSTYYQPVLSPAKLNVMKPITQSSWVAGGFWGSAQQSTPLGVNTFQPISRSSSQSSGFVSSSSNPQQGPVCNSRPGSRCGSFGDLDRHSIFSESPFRSNSSNPYWALGDLQCSTPRSESVHSYNRQIPSCVHSELSTGNPETTKVLVLEPSFYLRLVCFTTLVIFFAVSVSVNLYLGCYYFATVK